jgi:hypothetical protein
MKVLKEIKAQISLKKTLHVIDSQSMSINANIAEVQLFFPTLTILNLLTGLLQTNLQDFGTVRIFTTFLFSEKQL